MNSFQSISGDSENSSVTSRGVSRRSVMKAGAAAAWSVPLVQVVAAAPAVAVSGATLDVSAVAGSFTGIGTGSNEQRSTNMSFSVSTTGWTPPAAVTVTIAFTGGIAAPVTPPNGWAPSGNASTTRTFVKSLAGAQATNTWSETGLRFTGLRDGNTNSAITGSVSVNGTDAVAGPKTDSSPLSLNRA